MVEHSLKGTDWQLKEIDNKYLFLMVGNKFRITNHYELFTKTGVLEVVHIRLKEGMTFRFEVKFFKSNFQRIEDQKA